MVDINFKNVKPYEGDQRKGFEELICQLARQESPSNAKEFRRIEGAGGDAGVEAYWLLTSGDKIGFQAKYFTRTGDIDWKQVDKSVKQAMELHPEIIRYIVSFACDLTDRGGKKGQGFTGWKHWDNHKVKWNGWASKKGLSIEFEPWTKSDIVGRLIQPKNRGLIEYWFHTSLFDIFWFEKQFDMIKADLDERYHPEDHVEIHATELFDGLARSNNFQVKLVNLFKNILTTTKLRQHLTKLNVQPEGEVLNNIDKALIKIESIGDNITISPYLPLPFDCWQDKVNEGIENIEALDNWLWEMEREKENPPIHGQSN